MQDSKHSSEIALQALKEAVAIALDRKRKLGQYAIFVVDGKPVKVPPEELPKIS